MEDQRKGQSDALLSDRSSADGGDGDSEWKEFDAAFRGKTMSSAKLPRGYGGFHDGDDESGKLGFSGEAEQKLTGWSTESSREGRGPSPLASTTNRWVDYCSGYRSGSSGSITSNSTEDMVPVKNTRSGLLFTDRARNCAPGFDGGGGGCGGGGKASDPVASAGQRSNSLFFKNEISPEGITTARQAHRVRRLPLSVYTDATAFSSMQQQQQQQRERFNDRMFGGFLLLHGCLCEAPLAVVEGLLRGPLYLVAAAWVAIVALVGASGHVRQRAELSRHAAALAREGVLLLLASLTLAVPFSTTCTVYGEVADRGEDDWDVGPVPTPLGAVDPLRFFVFAFGQAGEFAANGRPKPLLRQADNHHPSRLSRSSELFAHSSPPGFRGVEVATDDEGLDNYYQDQPDDARRSGSSRFPPAALPRFGGIAAESMDTDRLGVGMLHPPQEIGLRLRRGGGSARRTTVSAYRRLKVSAARAYRRLVASSATAVASRPKNEAGSSPAETENGSGGSGEGAGVGSCTLV